MGSSNSFTISCKNSTLRCSGSISVRDKSGLAKAITIPGSPAPDPISTTETPSGMSVVTGMQLAMCRSQIRSPSLGPIKPRSIPALPKNSAYRSILAVVDGKNSANKVSRETVKLVEPPHNDAALHLQIHWLTRSLESCRG